MIDVGVGAGATPLSYQQRFCAPGAGSPNTVLSHAVPPVKVRMTYFESLPYSTSCVPEKAHVPRSLAHAVQLMAARWGTAVAAGGGSCGRASVPSATSVASGSGGAAAFVAEVCTIQQFFCEPGAGSPNTLLLQGLPPVSVSTT
jgi:hypothetical protein